MHGDRDWVGARKLLRKALRGKDPNSHWLMAKMAQTYNSEGKYASAMTWVRRALKLAPRCPIAQWEQVLALSGRSKHAQAVGVLKTLIRRPVRSYLAAGDCAQSESWVRTFVTDCYIMVAWEEQSQHRHAEAARAYRQHIRRRVRGSRSIVGGSLRWVRVNLSIQETLRDNAR